jgi:hypothetical protein
MRSLLPRWGHRLPVALIDLRHAAVSLWLNRGVPAPEVVQRAGHSVDVLLKVYAKCIEGDRVKVNKVAEDAFAE